jgi:hypothetical protein
MVKVILSERRATQAALDAKASEAAARAAEKEQAHLRAEAEMSLAELRQTAPTFYEQAQALIASAEPSAFEKALVKIAFAIKLDGANAGYHLLQANTVQSLARLGEAAESYRRALARRADDASAKENLALCENLLAENGGRPALSQPLKTKLLDAILAQKRQADAIPLSLELKRATVAFLKKHPALKWLSQQNNDYQNWIRDKGTSADEFWKKNGDRLARQVPMEKHLDKFRQLLIAEGNDPANVRRWAFEPDGQLFVGGGIPMKTLDLSVLRGVAITDFYYDRLALRDISPLSGAPLRSLAIPTTSVSDLSPLRGTPIEYLNLRNSQALRDDLSPLRGTPLRRIILDGSSIRDVSVLAEIKSLEEIILPANAIGVANLQTLPALKRISFSGIGLGGIVPDLSAAEFWKEFDAKKAAP